MMPATGQWSGLTDVALVFYDLDLSTYMHRKDGIKVVLWTGYDILRYELLCVAYAIKTPWESEPGSALGWAETAPTYVRTYGNGYHTYEDNLRNLSATNKTYSVDAVAVEFRTAEPLPGKGPVFNVALRLTEADGVTTRDINFDPSVYQFEFHRGEVKFSGVSPRIAGYTAGSVFTITGTGFHKTGMAYTDTTWLKDMVLRVGMLPTAEVKEPWWPLLTRFYPAFNLSSDRSTLTFEMPLLQVNSANMTVAVELTRNRQEFFRGWGHEIYLENAIELLTLQPQVWDRSHLRAYSLLPYGIPVTRPMVVTGSGFKDTGMIQLVARANTDQPGIPLNQYLGQSNVTFINSTYLHFSYPELTVNSYDFPKLPCATKASNDCFCDDWGKYEPTWNLDGNNCCLQPYEEPRQTRWCYCKINPPRPGEKVPQLVHQLCDPKFDTVSTYDVKMTLALNSSFGDHVPHPVYLSLYKTPVATSLSPNGVGFSQRQRIDIVGDGFLNTDALKGRVFIGGSTTPVIIEVMFVTTKLLYFYTPTWKVGNASIPAVLDLTMNGVNWHRLAGYNYEMPTYIRTQPASIDANGGKELALVGKNFMNSSTMIVRLRTLPGLKTEKTRLQKIVSDVDGAILGATSSAESLRLKGYEEDVLDAVIIRRMMIEALEETTWLRDVQRRDGVDYLSFAREVITRKMAAVTNCIASQHTYSIPVRFVSTTEVKFIVPRFCLPATKLKVEVDFTHNISLGRWGYQMNVLEMDVFNQTLVTPTQKPGDVVLDQQEIQIPTGGFARIGLFSGTQDVGPNGESLLTINVCKYLERGKETVRYGDLGVYYRDPHAQAPNSLFAGPDPKAFDMNTDYDVVHCYKLPRTPLISAGNRDGYLARYDVRGTMIWSVRLGGPGADAVSVVSQDDFENMYIAGSFYGADFSMSSKVLELSSDTDISVQLPNANLTQVSSKVLKLFLLKYTKQGKIKIAVEVAACVQAKDMCRIKSLNTDRDGNMYITGVFFGTATFGSMCATPQCSTYVQSKSEANEPARHEYWSPKQCNATTNIVGCTRIPKVKLVSMNQCVPEYSGRGKKCYGDVFVVMLNKEGELQWAQNVNTQVTWFQYSSIPDPVRASARAWYFAGYFAYFNTNTLRAQLPQSSITSSGNSSNHSNSTA